MKNEMNGFENRFFPAPYVVGGSSARRRPRPIAGESMFEECVGVTTIVPRSAHARARSISPSADLAVRDVVQHVLERCVPARAGLGDLARDHAPLDLGQQPLAILVEALEAVLGFSNWPLTRHDAGHIMWFRDDLLLGPCTASRGMLMMFARAAGPPQDLLRILGVDGRQAGSIPRTSCGPEVE